MYARWPNKAVLVAEALLCHAPGDLPLQAVDTDSVRGDLRTHVARIVHSLCEGKLSLLKVIEAIRDDTALPQQARTQIERASAEVGAQLVAQALARGEVTDEVDGGAVLMLAVGRLLPRALLDGRAPSSEYQRQLIENVLLPLCHYTAVMPPERATPRRLERQSRPSAS